MSDLTPITREEMILNGEDLTPITRLEYFLKKAAEGGGGYTEFDSTLQAGQTTVTITDSAITANSVYDIYTSVYGLNPTDVTVATGSITLTFDAQQSDLEVKVRVS